MTQNGKRFLSILLSLVLMLSLLPATVFAQTADSSAVACNTATGQQYASLSEATMAAQPGQTVKLLQDISTSMVYVLEDRALDLNGYTLQASYVSIFGDITDSSRENSGLLVVDANRMMLRSNNAQLPVITDAGYRFVELVGFNALMLNESKYVFQPLFEPAAHALLEKGQAATGVSVNVRVSWSQGDGRRSQLFAYNDSFVDAYLASYDPAKGAYGKMFTLTLVSSINVSDLQFEAVIKAASGVEVGERSFAGDDTESGGSTDVTTDENSKLTQDVTVETGIASAVVAQGTQLELGVTQVTLSTTKLEQSGSDVTPDSGEEMLSMDVHLEGVAADNTVPVLVTLNQLAPEFLNQGNITLYHVENGVTVPMTRVYSLADLDAHNEYYYDIITGTVTVALASFSEITVVSETAKPWEGGVDHTWYTEYENTSTDESNPTPYIIANADQLWSFSQIVGSMAKDKDGNTIAQDSFENKTVKLIADINLGDKESENNPDIIFYPIGYYNSDYTYEKTNTAITSGLRNFEGTFDGQGHTVSNFYQNTWEMKGDHDWYDATLQYYRDGMGLFGRVYKGTVKNLTIENFSSDGEIATTGCVAAYADGATFENIAIFNCNPRVYNIGNGGIVGCVGWYAKEANLKTTFTNITVDNSNKISALWGSYDVPCGGIVGQYYPTSGQSAAEYPVNAGMELNNCHVSAIMDVYNDVCANYQYYAYRYAGILIGSIRENETIDGHVYPKMDGITANGCTVHFGTWNDYYYCEFEKNGHPSYSGPDDYKFSRIEHSEINFTDTNGNGIIDTKEERDSVTGCKHNHTTVEDNQCVYLEFNNLVTGYGWGVTTKAVGDMDGVTILDREVADSVEKFEKADTAKDSYTTGATVTIGELFAATEAGLAEKTKINSAAVQVAVSPVGEESTAGGTYVAAKPDADGNVDWTQGTLTFSGTGAATITITDYYFCTPTTINITVTKKVAVEKFDAKLGITQANGNIIGNRVGNQNAVKLDSLFKAVDGAEIGTVDVTISTIYGATGTYTSNATWTSGTIQFSGTGVVKVTITDNNYCTPTELYLEVVDAVNATTATSATANNVVLLNDCGISSLTVSGRYTFYGNGFTATYSGNGQYLNNGLKAGIVTVSENGTLDNLRIVAPIYPKAYMYYGSTMLGDYVQGGPSTVDGDKTRYHYQLSAVAASGNATISNCYIYGGRNNIFVNTGDVTVRNSVLECGTVANVQIQSNASHTVTFENVTTIQHQVNPTIGDTSKVMLGAGVLVGPETTENPKIVLNGDFKQYNWVTSDDANAVSDTTITKAIIQGALDAAAYNHTVNGKTASNLGIIYMNTEPATVEKPDTLPYEMGDVSMKVSGNTVDGQVCSLQGATESQIYSDYENADKATENDWYEPQFKYSADLGDQYIPEGGDEHCYREGDTIHVMFPSGDTKELDLEALVDIQKYTGQDLNLEIACKDGSGNTITVTDGKITLSAIEEYTITYTVTDNLFYDEDGIRLENAASIGYSWDVTVSVSLKDTAVPNAYFEFVSANQKMGYYVKSSLFSTSVYQYIPFLAGLKIYDYNGQTAYLRFNGDTDYNKVAKIEVTNKYSGNDARIVVTLTDGGVIDLQLLSRADSGGGSTYTGSIKTSNNVVYFVNDGTTSEKDATTTAAYWIVDYYKFTGNNGVAIQSAAQKFTSTGSSASTPSGSFNTTIKYTVTYEANGGNCGQTVGYATSASAAVTLPTPTRSGYMFVGWFTAASGGDPVGGAGESYTPTANITLYAQWGKPSTVTYNANGGTCGTASEKYTGTALTLPTPTRDGYWFTGWYDAAEGGNKVGDAGTTYNPQSDITLYAYWQEKIEYTVTYNANGGTCSTASATYQGTALTLPTPTRTGYTFNGWYTAASGGTKIGDAGASYTPSANITLYAQWERVQYTITVTTSNATVSGVSNGDKAYYGDTITFTVTYSGDSNQNTKVTDANGNTVTTTGSYTFTMPASNVTINATSSCVTPDTLITLADGTQVRVDSLTGKEELLVWNLETGKLDSAPILFVDSDPEAEFEIIHLYFSDGTDVKVIYEHGFWDYDLNKYVYLDRYAEKYIGHTFAKQNGDKLEKVTLTDVVLETQVTTAWSPVTASHLCYFVNGMLSMPGGVGGLFNIFDVDPETMTYDYAAMERDIAKYGLFTYEELNSIEPLSEEMFEAAGGAYLKVSIGKGNLTMDELTYMIRRYSKYFE